MEFSSEVKKQIVEGFIAIFTRISSKEFQKRIWIMGKGPEMDSFDDTVNEYSIECDSIIENYKYFGITESQCQILKKFRDKFKPFYRENDFPEDFIDTPEWNEITEMAKDVLKEFDYKKSAHILHTFAKQNLETLLRNIDLISHTKPQKRKWIFAEVSQTNDFDECVSSFFGQSDSILKNYKEYEISDEQYQILKKFHDEFRIFMDENQFTEEFTDLPEWKKIIALSKEVLTAFNYSKGGSNF
jgi:hypothetical protein